jgi:hypothetical protein
MKALSRSFIHHFMLSSKMVTEQMKGIDRVRNSLKQESLRAIFAMELAFSHSLFLRLFLGFILLHPIYLFISLGISLVLGIHSFSHESSLLFAREGL